jgi:hypothetical protein
VDVGQVVFVAVAVQFDQHMAKLFFPASGGEGFKGVGGFPGQDQGIHEVDVAGHLVVGDVGDPAQAIADTQPVGPGLYSGL